MRKPIFPNPIQSLAPALVLCFVAATATAQAPRRRDDRNGSGRLDILVQAMDQADFRRGDSNGDGRLDISDPVHTLAFCRRLNANGSITRLGDSGSLAGEATMIRCVFHGGDRLVTSLRNGAGDLQLISWGISSDGRSIRRLADSGEQAGAIEDNALMDTPRGVISAVRRGDGRLLLISWELSGAGALQRRGDSYSLAGAASDIVLDRGRFGPERAVVSAVRAANRKLLLLSWKPTFD